MTIVANYCKIKVVEVITIKKKKSFVIITTFLTVLMISLVIMNEYSMHQVTVLCNEVGGTPEIDKNFLLGHWSVNCDRPSVGVNQ